MTVIIVKTITETGRRKVSEQRSFPLRSMVLGILISVVLLVVLQRFFGSSVDAGTVLRSWKAVLLGLMLFCMAIFIIAVRVYILSRSIGYRIKLIDCYSNSFLNQFFSAITPFSAGGQPFQIYDLTRLGMELSAASAMIITMFMISNLASVTLTLFVLPQFIWYFGHTGSAAGIVVTGALITVVVGGLLMVVALSQRLISSFSHFLSRRRLLLKLVSRLFRKDEENLSDSILKRFSNYNKSMKLLWQRSRRLLLLDYLLAISHFLCLYAVFYLVVTVVARDGAAASRLGFLDSVAVQSLLSFVVYYLPTPGSSGGFEGGMFILLKDVVQNDLLPLIVMLWRFVTYHMLILIGILIFLLTLNRRESGKAQC
ncbi:MAG: Uncharacterized protein XE05_1496 [Thermotogales bacterium 46_20]|nr:MAG: Uncharacterized protein XE05_1496 [Thermotogales bacterium 46_20]